MRLTFYTRFKSLFITIYLFFVISYESCVLIASIFLSLRVKLISFFLNPSIKCQNQSSGWDIVQHREDTSSRCIFYSV